MTILSWLHTYPIPIVTQGRKVTLLNMPEVKRRKKRKDPEQIRADKNRKAREKRAEAKLNGR